MLISIALVLGGLVLLSLAADRFVLSAARLARGWGLSPLLVGALIVGMGTSAPELLVSVLGALDGELDLALGNAVGSNVTNVTLVLGLAALIHPLTGDLRVLRREGMTMLVVCIVLAWLLWDGSMTRTEGLGLVAGMIVAGWLIIRWAKEDAGRGFGDPDESLVHAPVSVGREVALGIVSLGLTLLGADLLVRGATSLAEALGLASAFVGLTIVAVGTSLPELATSIAAVRRGEHEIVVGNVLGSNIFNALVVGGAASAISPGAVDPSMRIGAAFMVLSAAVAGLFSLTGRTVQRWEGALLLLAFAGFVVLSWDPGLVARMGLPDLAR
jgi:cation:H+ antiporter